MTYTVTYTAWPNGYNPADAASILRTFATREALADFLGYLYHGTVRHGFMVTQPMVGTSNGDILPEWQVTNLARAAAHAAPSGVYK